MANPGDRIVLRSRYLVKPIRVGEIVAVRGSGARPPYLVKWSDEERPSWTVPGSNAHIYARSHWLPPARSVP